MEFLEQLMKDTLKDYGLTVLDYKSRKKEHMIIKKDFCLRARVYNIPQSTIAEFLWFSSHASVSNMIIPRFNKYDLRYINSIPDEPEAKRKKVCSIFAIDS